MYKNCTMKTIRILVMLFFLAGTAIGGGFENTPLSMKAASMGGTFTAIGSDASTAFYNPAAMSFLEFSQISLGASFTLNSSSYLSPYMGNSEMTNKLAVHPHVYGVGMLSEKAAVGISVNTPFCLRSVWDDNWTGRYIVRENKIAATYVQPAISFMFSKSFSVGGGPIVAFGKTIHSSAISYNSNSGELAQELNGNSTGFGVNIALYLKPNENFRMGLTYRSAVTMKVKDGAVNFSNVPQSLETNFPSSTTFSTSYKLPSVTSFGVAVKLTRELLLSGEINYTTWKSFDSLQFTFKDQPGLDFSRGEFYKNTFALRMGVQIAVSDKIELRVGGAYDTSPVPDDYLSPENPDAQKFVISGGGSVKLSEHLKLDLAYMLENYKEREVKNSELNFSGNYKSLKNIFGLTLNYEF